MKAKKNLNCRILPNQLRFCPKPVSIFAIHSNHNGSTRLFQSIPNTLNRGHRSALVNKKPTESYIKKVIKSQERRKIQQIPKRSRATSLKQRQRLQRSRLKSANSVEMKLDIKDLQLTSKTRQANTSMGVLPSNRCLAEEQLILRKPAKPRFQLSYSFRTRQGKIYNYPQKVNQDIYLAKPKLGKLGKKSLFGVGDGHGLFGHQVSAFIKANYIQLLQEDPCLNSMPIKALSRSFERLQAELANTSIDTSLSGSTLSLILLDQTCIYTANVGDSRSILCRRTERSKWEVSNISREHKPHLQSQRARIIRSGGRVEKIVDEDGRRVGPDRVWLRNADLPGLAMSRSIGDSVVKQVGVSHLPQVMKFQLLQTSHILMVASDGVWDFLAKQDVAQLVVPFYQTCDIEGASDRILAESLARWTRDSDQVVDDITFVLVFLYSES